MPANPPGQIPIPATELLVELPSWHRTFFSNVRDLILPRRLPALDIRSAPAPFWPDVFVQRPLPWNGFLKSTGCHILAFALVVAFTRLFALQPRLHSQPTFDRSQVVYYSAAEYLPPLDTRAPRPVRSERPDPESSGQPIISVPRESDNRSQTIVTPPSIKLRQNVALPNIVAWSDTPQPRLEIPPIPLTPAAEINRFTPQLNSVVTPPADISRLTQNRNRATLNAQVVAPPSDVAAMTSSTQARMRTRQTAVIAPPASLELASNRPFGELTIGHSAVIAPAPRLPVSEQRAASGGRSGGSVTHVVPPPPAAGASSGSSSGARGRIIALNLRPAVGAPADLPAGNRRGSFAATPEGHAGATGTPGGARGGANDSSTGSNGMRSSDIPPGLYVGSALSKTSPVAGDSKAASGSVNSNPSAGTRATTASRTTPADNAAKLTAPERAVFGNRRFYSLSLNMPNLNSAGGSWIIRFAELNHASTNANSIPAQDDKGADLSQPTATLKVDPAYPLQLMRENVAGTVILYGIIRADGTVGNVRILRGVDDRLDKFATQAVAQWKFTPATKNGVPVDVEATFQIPFRPSRIGTNF